MNLNLETMYIGVFYISCFLRMWIKFVIDNKLKNWCEILETSHRKYLKYLEQFLRFFYFILPRFCINSLIYIKLKILFYTFKPSMYTCMRTNTCEQSLSCKSGGRWRGIPLFLLHTVGFTRLYVHKNFLKIWKQSLKICSCY